MLMRQVVTWRVPQWGWVVQEDGDRRYQLTHHAEVEVEVEVDTDALCKDRGPRLVGSRRGVTTMADGAIKLRIVRPGGGS